MCRCRPRRRSRSASCQATCTAAAARAASICCSPIRRAAAPIAPIAVSRVTARPSANYADRNFIRVDWPAVPMAQIVDIVARDGAKSPFHRMCISMITHPALRCRHRQRAEGLDRAHRPEQHPGLDSVQSDDDVARRCRRAEGSRRRHLHRRARCGDAGDLRSHARQGRAVAAHLAQVLGDPG